jgi:methylthioribose-1-phosphate isomerase
MRPNCFLNISIYSKIRGAPAIASLASLSVAQNLSRMLQEDFSTALASVDALRAYLIPVLDFLYTARPTAVNLGTAIRRLRAILLAAIDETTNVRSVVQKLVAEAHLIADEDVGRNKKMGQNGAEWLLSLQGISERLDNGKVNVYVLPASYWHIRFLSADR